MQFIPDYTLNIIKDKNFKTEIKNIETVLLRYQNTGYFDTFDGEKNYYEYFLCENSKGSVVIVHGLSEFTKKFYEVTYYFLNQGYNVFLYDQRCHGKSSRLASRIELIHVDSFKDYVRDLEVYINEIVNPIESGSVYLYSHSMGGAVAAMYLAENTDKIKKAVLSAPLLEPCTGKVPPFVARFGIKLGVLICGGKEKSKTSGEFNPEAAKRHSNELSRNRFLHNLNMRCENPCYQSTPMTYSWVYNSLIVTKKFLTPKICRKITTPILLLCAEKDTVVKTKPQFRFSKNCKSCELAVIKESNHSMLTHSHETITEHITRVLDFYRD